MRINRLKKYLAGLLAILFLLTDLPPGVTARAAQAEDKWVNYAAEAFAGGSGTQEDPYQISGAEHLALVAQKYNTKAATAGKYFKVMAAQIDLTAHEWVPVTTFSGHFDGNGAVIRGLHIGEEQEPAAIGNAGMFGTLLEGSTVKNLVLEEVSVYNQTTTGAATAGGIAGFSSGDIDGCSVSGSITGTAAGVNYTAENGIKSDIYVGGIAGRVRVTAAGKSATVTNCVNRATVSAVRKNGTDRYVYVGGIAGYMHSTVAAAAAMVNCANTGAISAEGTATKFLAGGLVGFIGNEVNAEYSFALMNSYNAGRLMKADGSNAVPGSVAGGGKNTNLSALYYLAGTADSAGSLAADAAEEVQDPADEAFLETLNANAAAINETTGYVAYAWEAGQNGMPFPGKEPAAGKVLTVSANSAVMGTVTIEYREAGSSETWKELQASSRLFAAGTEIRITIAPQTGCELSELTRNGETVAQEALTDDGTGTKVYTFVLDESTEIQVIFAAGSAQDGGSYYVDPNASVNGDGSQDSPFNTLAAAIAGVKAVLAKTINSNITVYLMDGTYVLEEPLVLDESIASLGRVTFKNAQGASPVITGAVAVPGSAFIKAEDRDYYVYHLPEDAKKNGEYPKFRDLLVDGQLATMARTGDYLFKKSYKNQEMTGGKLTHCENTLYIDPESLMGVTSQNLNGVEIMSFVEWKSQLFHIAGINEVEGQLTEITLKDNEWNTFNDYDATKRTLVGRVYYLQNHLNFLDEPGEFWYDQEQGTIYYYPYADQDMNSLTVEYALQDTLVEIRNTANLTFDGITFTGTTTNFVTENGLAAGLGACYYTYASDPGTNVPCAAIYADKSTGITIRNCTFEELGGTGFLADYGTKNLELTGNTIKNVGIAGISIGVNQRQWGDGASENVEISNNYITGVGRFVPCAPGIKVARADNLKIRHNTLIHVSYTAIMAGWGWNVHATNAPCNTNLSNTEIAYNYIEDFLYAINDGGAIYTCGANGFVTDTEIKNTIHDNYIRAGAHNGTYTGIYHDGSASNWHTYHNVIENIVSGTGPMYFQDSVESQYSHNILAENNFTTVSEIPSREASAGGRNVTVRSNTMLPNSDLLPEEALAIKEAAGIEAGYQKAMDPMDTGFRILENTIHFQLTEAVPSMEVRIQVTNHSDHRKKFTLSLADGLPRNTVSEFVGNGVALQAGEAAVITMRISVENVQDLADSAVSVVGFQLADGTGRITEYPRAISVATVHNNEKVIAYGTPVIDGRMDDIYQQSTITALGTVFYPSSADLSGVTGWYRLVWDETYLYLYAFVEDEAVLSRGMELINQNDPNTMWANDSIEAYIMTKLRGSDKMTKFAVDAFGIRRFGNAGAPSIEYHNALPYATAFMDHGQILENYRIEAPTAGQNAADAEHSVNGFVVEMVLPITEITSLQNAGEPQEGDSILFYLQNNDYQGDQNGQPTVVALKNAQTTYTLIKPKPGYTAGIATTADKVAKGDTVLLPVKAAHSTDSEFHAAEIKIRYDNRILEFNKEKSELGNASVEAKNGMVILEDYGSAKAFGSAVYTIAFDAVACAEETKVVLETAAFTNAENASRMDLQEAVSEPCEVAFAVTRQPVPVEIDHSWFVGSSTAEYGQTYSFGLAEYGEYYTYEFTATMEDEDGSPKTVQINDNGDGTFTVAGTVTGKLVIRAVRFPKIYAVSFAGEGGKEAEAVEGNKTIAAYGTDYCFALPADTEEFLYSLHAITIGGKDYTDYRVEDGKITIPGADVKGAVIITVDKAAAPEKEVKVTVEGNGAGDASYAPTAKKNHSYVLTLLPKAGYVYTVTAVMASGEGGTGETVALQTDGNQYTIEKVTGDIVFTITRNIDTELLYVSAEPYLKLDGTNIWLVIREGTAPEGSTFTYDGQKMFWSEKYNAYCYLVVADTLDKEEAASKLDLISGDRRMAVYDGDVNMTGKTDASDAQLVYNMYQPAYSGFTEEVSMEKYLRADVNGDKKVDVLDAAAIIHRIMAQ